jgi:sarcosine oxidase subunit beta
LSTSTTVIIGGGVTALSTAYHLALKGAGKIIVIDKGPIGDGSSSRAAAIVTGLLWSETGVKARQIALRRFRELSEELDGYEFQARGCLNLFDAVSWPEREALLPVYDEWGTPYEIVDAAEIHRRWPALTPTSDIVGLYDPLGGYSEPDEYIPALLSKCRELGVEIREHEAVTEILVRDGRAAGVRTANGEIGADAVVSTVYAWTAQVLEPLGIRLPVKSFVHQRYVTAPLSAPVDIPPVNANTLYGYFRPAAGNRLLVGIETAEREEHHVTRPDFHMNELTTASNLKDTIRQNMTPLLPVLAEAEWETEKVGLLTFSMDGEPILGPVAALPGLHVGVAFHSGGFAYNPASGLLLAESVADGKTSIDLSAFAPERFDAAEADAYLAETVIQANAARRRH